jgi:NADH:ubiquinone oxidoreductase subunit 4 (subunit M)
MLHAGVLMKLGAFGVMRIGMVLLPEGANAWMPVVGGVAALNVLYGAFCAMSQTDLEYIVAYSSVSHMGVVMLGAATLTPEGWNGAVFQRVAHGVMTGLYFALVGAVYERAHTRNVPAMGGFATAMPGVAAFFTLACLSSLGLPGTAGFVSEFLVFVGAWKSGHVGWAVPGVVGAFVTAVYVLRATRDLLGPRAERALPRPRRPEGPRVGRPRDPRRVPRRLRALAARHPRRDRHRERRLALAPRRHRRNTVNELRALWAPIAVAALAVSALLLDAFHVAARAPRRAGEYWIPVMAGFWAKLYVFLAAWQAGHRGLVVAGVALAAVEIYYDLQVLRAAYTRERTSTRRP